MVGDGSQPCRGNSRRDVIFTDDEALRALLDMEIFFGDTLTVRLNAAWDELILIKLYDAKGGFVASGMEFSVLEFWKTTVGIATSS